MKPVGFLTKMAIWLGLASLLPAVVMLIVHTLFPQTSLLVPLLAGVTVALLISFVFGRQHVRRLRLLESKAKEVVAGRPIEGATDFRGEPELLALWQNINQASKLIDTRRPELEQKIRREVETELAGEKQQVEAFLQSIGDGISIVDRDMRVIYLNDPMIEVFGNQVGEYCYRVYEHKGELCTGCPVKIAMETGQIHRSLRRVYDKHGNLRYYEATGSPIRDQQGNIVAGLELTRDVTLRIKLERSVEIRSRQLAAANAELRRTNEQLRKAYEAQKEAQMQLVNSEKMASLGVLVSGLAHEINNPLNFVSASTKLLADNLRVIFEIIQEYDNLPLSEEMRREIDRLKTQAEFGYLTEDIQKIVKNIATGAERMKTIVQNLRVFSRLDSGVREDVNLLEGLESTLQLLYYQYKDRIEIERDFEPLPPISGNPGQLNQVFMNILHNSVQAIPAKGKITISTRSRDGLVQVAIRDSGIGIDPQDIPHVFDPFFTTKKVGEGTGLGLSISYGIIESHGGRLWVESEKGAGSTFFLELPAVEPKTKQKGD
ncbi:MAG: PAS domain S-box protein [Myxococcales bacterium]|nr:PAS domain S-box protein [Myxococcales bacterium]